MIYFEKYPEPKPYSYKIGDKTHEGFVVGEWKCEHPAVERVWWTVGKSPIEGDDRCFVFLNMILKDGTRKEWKTNQFFDITENKNPLTQQAIEFLNSLPK